MSGLRSNSSRERHIFGRSRGRQLWQARQSAQPSIFEQVVVLSGAHSAAALAAVWLRIVNFACLGRISARLTRATASSGLALPHPGSVPPAIDFVSSISRLGRSGRPGTTAPGRHAMEQSSLHCEDPRVLFGSDLWEVTCHTRRGEFISRGWRACDVLFAAVFSISLCRSKSSAVPNRQRRR